MEGILQQLSEYAASEVYPFHMPGHKRNMPEEISRLAGAAKMDITEIEGVDDLHGQNTPHPSTKATASRKNLRAGRHA